MPPSFTEPLGAFSPLFLQISLLIKQFKNMKSIKVLVPVPVTISKDDCSVDSSHKSICEGLAEICENVHSSCDSSCPVYEINGEIPNTGKTRHGCDCFKNGEAMLKFLQDSIV
jgi:hypothetical protein